MSCTDNNNQFYVFYISWVGSKNAHKVCPIFLVSWIMAIDPKFKFLLCYGGWVGGI